MVNGHPPQGERRVQRRVGEMPQLGLTPGETTDSVCAATSCRIALIWLGERSGRGLKSCSNVGRREMIVRRQNAAYRLPYSGIRFWKDGRAVYCTCLESRRRCKSPVSSNLTPSSRVGRCAGSIPAISRMPYVVTRTLVRLM